MKTIDFYFLILTISKYLLYNSGSLKVVDGLFTELRIYIVRP